MPASTAGPAESGRTWIPVEGVGKFGPVFFHGADRNDCRVWALSPLPGEAFEGRANLLPKEGPINILLHLKLRGAGYITLAVHLLGAVWMYV